MVAEAFEPEIHSVSFRQGAPMLGIPRGRLLVVPLLTCACQTWSTVPLSPSTPGPLPKHSTVVLVGGERVQVEDGRSTRDSLIGDRLNGAPFAVSRDSVNFVETRKVSVARSLGVGAGTLAVVSLAAAAVFVAAFSALSPWQ
jgi:hypothetical protein